MDKNYDIAVIGGGPAGMMAAARAAELGATVILLEKNPGLGKKLLISGGGRCNILNAEFDTHTLVDRYGKKGKSLYSTFSQFDAQATWDFFESKGLKLKIEPEQRAFPVTDNAADVRNVLAASMAQGKVQVLTGVTVKGIEADDGLITKVIHDAGSLVAKNYILATGGKSHPETGSTGDGFVWMKKLGHTVIEQEAALVPITIRNPWIKDVAGISLKNAKLTVFQGTTKHESKTGKMLFTHIGLSGPMVLNMSKNIGTLLKTGPVTLSLDLFPTFDPGALDKHIIEVFEKGKNKMIKNNIGELVQPRLGHVILSLAGIDFAVPLHQLTREDRLAFGALLKDFPMSVSGLLGEDKAVVTGGGVDLKEVEFKTMRSKKFRNLFLAGDILDFDRPSGGFSLQICWTTGYVAGSSAADQRTTA
ncbi:MAG: NAD(P)/FAD-dependent oxidoreductase [Candidatus Peribacteraceae bacterium]|nr:NAD(P)/FAD-dependent oxidoreductase [Candidatus Peribacteraceae bacterium]